MTHPRATLAALAFAAPLTLQAAAAAIDPATGTRFQADADMKALLQAHAALGPKPIEKLDVPTARQQPSFADAVKARLTEKKKSTAPETMVPGVTSVDTQVQGAAGMIPARVFTPRGKGPFPVVVYFHGGGWVIADREVYDGGARSLAKEAGAVVVSVDYRRAPEAKFPAAWDDAFAAYQWVAANAASMNGDPKRLALAGESAGGNLAVSTAIAARDKGAPLPRSILAVYPVAQTGNMETPSYVDSANAKPLNKEMIGWFVDKLFADPKQKSDTRIDIVNADLAGLPPVTIINAEIDPLRSDGDLLAAALRKAGVKVDHKLYKGATHEFFGAGAVVKDAKDANQYGGQALKRSLG